MGNASGKEDGDSSSEAGGEESHFHEQSMEESGENSGPISYYDQEGPPDLMGQSPPHSPVAAQSPLMFTPQVPVAPLQRPDELHIPSHAWMQNANDTEDMLCEQKIPTMITWSHGGKEVAVEGSWDDWKTKKPLQRSGKDFIIIKVLPSGVYQYRFIVDGEWRHAPDLPCAQDDMGNAYNVLDLKDYVPEDLESVSGFEPPQSPESSYNSMHLGSEDYAKEPPLVPPHLETSLLNAPPSSMEKSCLSRPQHVLLNHLYVQKGKSNPSVVAFGSTNRFHAKYVTVVLYKPMQR